MPQDATGGDVGNGRGCPPKRIRVTLPKRRHTNSRRAYKARCNQSHLAWIRGFACIACGSRENIEAAHVRIQTDGGTSLKPDDKWTVPLCHLHHAMQHGIGEPHFERKYGLDLKAEAEKLARQSPHLRKIAEVA